MDDTILSGYLSNLGKYTEGRPVGEWVTFPTTAEHLKEVFDRIGIDFINLMDRYAYGGPPFSLLTGDFPVTTFLPMQSKIMLIF